MNTVMARYSIRDGYSGGKKNDILEELNLKPLTKDELDEILVEKDIWDKEFGEIKLPPQDEIVRQLNRYRITDGTGVRLYLGKYVTQEEFERKKAKVFSKFP